ncbi:DUF7691 family protein [Streptomyces tailanensis]|uniref:DUF7691 family protein n=1 Tax=Streptomyces tailanensis TaxID=2569858 RepID=UPI001FE70FFC|nr:hypothetical protein [Streptomyces tailanensis]
MSSSLSVYLLDVAATRALVGSRDEQLLDVIRSKFGDDLARDDDWFKSEIEDGAPTAYEALRAVESRAVSRMTPAAGPQVGEIF